MSTSQSPANLYRKLNTERLNRERNFENINRTHHGKFDKMILLRTRNHDANGKMEQKDCQLKVNGR